jgi:hypothetical protein
MAFHVNQVKKLQAEKRLDLLVDIDLKTDYNSLELEEMVQVHVSSKNTKFSSFIKFCATNTTITRIA